MRKRLQNVFGRFDFSIAGKWLFLGGLVGVVSGLGAILLQLSIQVLREVFLVKLAGLDLGGPQGEPAELGLAVGRFIPWIVVALPALGGLASGMLVYWLAPEAEGHGTDAAIDAFHRKLGRIRPRVPLVKLATSAITIGTGGSGGREGPIAQIGAGFGSFLATRLGLSSRDRRLLLAAGIGGGVGAIFRAPLAGAIFAAEVLYTSADVEAEVLLPAMISSIVGYAVFASRFGWAHMFGGSGHFGFHNPLELGPYLALAIVVAGAALLYIRVFYGANRFFSRLTLPRVIRPMLGGLVTGVLGLALIMIFGKTRDIGDVLSSGYGIIQHIIDGDGAELSAALLLCVALGKIFTTSSSIGSGGSGGVFGPSMVIGACLGGAVGITFHQWIPTVVEHPATFAVVGMAGFFAAAAKTPISTVIMVSELTGDYELLVPSMWVCAFAFLVSRDWTIYRSQLPSRAGVLPQTGSASAEMVAHLKVADVFRRQRKFAVLRPELPLGEVMKISEASRQRVFPVTDDGGALLGAFRVEQLLHAARDESLRGAVARDLIDDQTFFVFENEAVERAQRMLRNNNLEEVLVLSRPEERKLLGILTIADILLAYQRTLSGASAAPADGVTEPPRVEAELGPEKKSG
jgi:CIC family chloride channel protein